MTEFIYLQTVQHTGTWFIGNFVMEHEEMGQVIQENHIIEGLRGDDIGESHTHGDKVVVEGIVPNKKNLILTHIASHSRKEPPFLCPRQKMITMACNRPLVVPLRDPLLAMITHRKRHPNWKEAALFHKITTWQLYFKFLMDFAKHRKIVYCPIDVLEGKGRTVVLKKIQAAYGLKDDTALVERWAEEWPVLNTSGGQKDPPKQAYYSRNLAWFEENMSKELAALREWEHVLRPILEKYYKNLLWWS